MTCTPGRRLAKAGSRRREGLAGFHDVVAPLVDDAAEILG